MIPLNIPFSSKSLGNNILKCIRDLASKPSIQPQTPEVSVGISNRTEHFGLVRSEYSGPGLKVVLFDQSGHFGRSVGPKCPFPFDKIAVPSTALLYPAYNRLQEQ